MPVNIASDGNVSLARLVEFAAYNTDDSGNGFLEMTIAGIFDTKEPADISVLIEGKPEKSSLRDRSEIWVPDSGYMLPYLTNIPDSYRDESRRRDYPYRIETQDGKTVSADLYSDTNFKNIIVPVERLDAISEEHHPADSPSYTIARFQLKGNGLSLVTFGYTTREGVTEDIDTRNDENWIALSGFDGVFRGVNERIEKSNPKGYEPWDKQHFRDFTQNSLLRDYRDENNLRHILILATLRGSTIYFGRVHFHPFIDKDKKDKRDTYEIITTPNDNFGNIVYLQLNETNSVVSQIAKPGCFGREIPEGPKYAMKL